MYTNCRSLSNKSLEFEQLINAERIHFAAITETWFKPGMNYNYMDTMAFSVHEKTIEEEVLRST